MANCVVTEYFLPGNRFARHWGIQHKSLGSLAEFWHQAEFIIEDDHGL
jgi:hypothetical protein